VHHLMLEVDKENKVKVEEATACLLKMNMMIEHLVHIVEESLMMWPLRGIFPIARIEQKKPL